jgi:tetratricopeptide (TPR) repeat protein
LRAAVAIAVAATLPGFAGAARAEEDPPAAPTGPAAFAEAIAAGDAHYARRGEGADERGAPPFQIDGAIAEYRRALALDPTSLEARVRLMRAYFFRGGFCGEMPRDEKVRLFDEAKRLAEEVVSRLDTELGRKKGKVTRDAASRVTPAAEAYLWSAVSWGQWAVFHRVSAAWSGAPGRIRDLAEAVIVLDPGAEQAGAHIILGRLHSEAPKIPLVTGFVSREKAVAAVRAGIALAPENRALAYFTADVLLRHAPGADGEAREILARVSSTPPRADFRAEDLHYARMARERLAGLR